MIEEAITGMDSRRYRFINREVIQSSKRYAIYEYPCNFEKSINFAVTIAGIAQLVEHDLAKVGAASSSLVSRSEKRGAPEKWGAFLFFCGGTSGVGTFQ